MNTKHTPTPWHIRYANNLTAVVTPDGEMQLSVHGVYDGLKPLSVDLQTWQANAAFIVSACNSHADLVAALEECITTEGAACFSDMVSHPERMQFRLHAISDLVHTALAKAKGE